MIRGFAVLLSFQLLGELAVRGFAWPVPGNVLGMALLFVPVGVGVMLYFDLLAREWLPIVAATVLSTFVVLAVTGHVTKGLAKDRCEGEGGDG